MTLTVQLMIIKYKKKTPRNKQLSGRLQDFEKEENPFIVPINTAIYHMRQFGNFLSNQSVSVIF